MFGTQDNPQSGFCLIIAMDGIDEWKHPTEEALDGGRGMFCVLPLAKSLVQMASQSELGKFGIVCIEDMAHQIDNVGPHFKEVVRFMWPFELNKPAEGLKGSKTRFKDGGDAGDREDLINELINKMN